MQTKLLLCIILLLAAPQLYSSAMCPLEGCNQCNPSDVFICLKCMNGYKLDLTTLRCKFTGFDANSCSSSVTNCLKCGDDSSKCEKCFLNYELTSDGSSECKAITCRDPECSPVYCAKDRDICGKCSDLNLHPVFLRDEKKMTQCWANCEPNLCKFCHLVLNEGFKCKTCNNGANLNSIFYFNFSWWLVRECCWW
jgi:hypothetical protein